MEKLSKEALIRDILDHPDSHAKRLGIIESCIKYAIKRLGIGYKKTLNHPKADPGKRSMFCQTLKRLEKACKSINY
ncbi:IS630 transposase-related protein, partial [Candidatus Cyrtobacter comes]|uniref:IS630 transposase-related protein n=1 Tax=Candidatus Cyrtobacter comes TaxID=675776 RepID=UPI002ACE9262